LRKTRENLWFHQRTTVAIESERFAFAGLRD
jgi:hypothetical protein